jgi:hypothetical protein
MNKLLSAWPDGMNQPAGTVTNFVRAYRVAMYYEPVCGFIQAVWFALYADSIHRRSRLRTRSSVKLFDHVQHALRDFADLAGCQKREIQQFHQQQSL